MFLVLPNNRENVIQHIIPVIALKKIFKTPMLNLFVGKTLVFGGITIVEGIVQNTKVVPKIDSIVELLEGTASMLFG